MWVWSTLTAKRNLFIALQTLLTNVEEKMISKVCFYLYFLDLDVLNTVLNCSLRFLENCATTVKFSCFVAQSNSNIAALCASLAGFELI